MPGPVTLAGFIFYLFWFVFKCSDLNMIKFNQCPGFPKFKETNGPVLSC